MERKRIQDGQPTVEVGTYHGYAVRVVVGYIAVEDAFAVHLYITPPGGPEIRVFDPARRESLMSDALDLGFKAAQSEIDQLIPD